MGVWFEYNPVSPTSEYKPLKSSYDALVPAVTRQILNNDIFPVQKVDMEGNVIEVPRNFEPIARALFGENYMQECKSREWDRANEKSVAMITIACQELLSLYPISDTWKGALGIPLTPLPPPKWANGVK